MHHLNRTIPPLGWTTYGYNNRYGTFMPEEIWEKNIDWVADTFRESGFTMICNDGWTVNEEYNRDGYLTKYDDRYQHDIAYWADYIRKKGLVPGIYWNPLWISTAAGGDPFCKIQGTDLPVSSLCHEDDRYKFSNCYWADITQPGAENYVKGYMNYFKSMGIQYMKIDFLSWYESGKDWNLGEVCHAHGRENYKKALTWIREAAGEEMQLLLCMGNLKHDAEYESVYGDLIRINNDIGSGTWETFSLDRRGQRTPDTWSQWSNTFDGFIGWAHLARDKKVLLDGDYPTISSYSNDLERKTVISLYVMAGSPLIICEWDEVDDNYSDFYKNPFLLRLLKQGFRGEPLRGDPSNELSQIWKGRDSDGSWIVGLFNREEKPRVRSIDFTKELGISLGKIYELWERNPAGISDEYTAVLAPHACRLIQVTPV